MLGFLFRGLTAEPARAAPLFDRLTAEARRPDWYVAGQVPDTLNGRFAVLATVTALALVRLEQEGETGNRASVSLTERFIQVMESEHRELGLGDPNLGKTVRKLVAMLGRRNEIWRTNVVDAASLTSASRDSLYGGGEVATDALDASARLIEDFRARLAKASVADLEQGRIG